MTDKEIIESLKESSDSLDLLYERHKEYCLNFMNKINFNSGLNKEIFHDALIVLYEKVLKGNFEMTCSIQTYLNSICRNQLLVRLKKESKHATYSEEFDERIDDWFEVQEDENSVRMMAIVKALEKLRELGGKCYEILRSYFYENKSMEKIAYELEYSNADNAKNQKARCQKRLKELVFEITGK
jgi:RNA polymerase sigma factor (sigma-70 family)